MNKLFVDVENPVLYRIVLEKEKTCENNNPGNSTFTITGSVNDDELKIDFDAESFIGEIPDDRTGLVALIEFFVRILKETYNLNIDNIDELVANQKSARLVYNEMYQRGSYLLAINRNYIQNNTEFIYKEDVIKQVCGTIRKD